MNDDAVNARALAADYADSAHLYRHAAPILDAAGHAEAAADLRDQAQNLADEAARIAASLGEDVPAPIKRKAAELDADALDQSLGLLAGNGDRPDAVAWIDARPA